LCLLDRFSRDDPRPFGDGMDKDVKSRRSLLQKRNGKLCDVIVNLLPGSVFLPIVHMRVAVTPLTSSLGDSTVILSIRCDGNFYVQEAKSTESVIICIHGTRLPSGEETTSSADRSDRSVEGGSGVLIHPGSSQRKS
ncbi:hypothetical protein T4A_2903, partial [Trichinella pseudospiralis]